jgi:DNA repair protein RadD
MILRERQREFVGRCLTALKKHGNTLGIAPTGAGKTVMLSAIAGALPGPSIILQHRDELVEQNERTFRKINPKIRTSFVTGDYKRFEPTGATFAMIQTLQRDNNLAQMPAVARIIVDEAHHVASNSYIKVLEHAKRMNPDLQVLGVTATPKRGDTRNLRAAFTNVADQITLTELIAEGHLVPPTCFVMEIGITEELKGVRKTASDFDMGEVEKIMDKRPINERVVEEWQKVAGERQTVVFCSTVDHAMHVNEAFRAAGVRSNFIHGDMHDTQRADILNAYATGALQVLVNVMILTEGWDDQPTSCVVMLRPCSYKGTMIQMIGRGLRTVDPEKHPGVIKNDCIVLDFGCSLRTHKSIEVQFRIETDGETKDCPSCGANLPGAVPVCPICEYEFPATEADEAEEVSDGENIALKEDIADFVMTEFDVLQRSPFKWESFFDGVVWLANGMDAWASIVFYRGHWYAIGGASESGMAGIAVTDSKMLALTAADNFLREHGDDDTCAKSKRWLSLPPSDKQLQWLGVNGMGAIGLSRYRASCMITWKKYERPIQQKLARLAA